MRNYPQKARRVLKSDRKIIDRFAFLRLLVSWGTIAIPNPFQQWEYFSPNLNSLYMIGIGNWWMHVKWLAIQHINAKSFCVIEKCYTLFCSQFDWMIGRNFGVLPVGWLSTNAIQSCDISLNCRCLRAFWLILAHMTPSATAILINITQMIIA